MHCRKNLSALEQMERCNRLPEAVVETIATLLTTASTHTTALWTVKGITTCKCIADLFHCSCAMLISQLAKPVDLQSYPLTADNAICMSARHLHSVSIVIGLTKTDFVVSSKLIFKNDCISIRFHHLVDEKKKSPNSAARTG